MRSVVYVAPFFPENTTRTVRAFAETPGVRLGVISQQPPEAMAPDLREKVAAHQQVANAMDGAQLAKACRALQASLGPIDRLVGALEQLQVPLAEAREAVGIEGLWTQAAHNFRDKSRMKAVLREAGLPVARSRLLASPADAWPFVEEVGFPIVVKPPAGLGAAATFRVGGADELRSLFERFRPSPGQPMQAEEFVRGVEENTFETVSIAGKPVWASGTRYFPGPLEVIENPWMQYCVLLPREADDPRFTSFAPLNFAALEALGQQTGLSHMEWFRRADGSAVISEVGARPPGVNIMPMNSFAYDADITRAWARLMSLDEWHFPGTRKYAAGCAFFRGQGQGRIRALHGLDEAQERVGPWVVDRKLPVVGAEKSSHYEGDGWALVRHPDSAVVLDALKVLITTVKVEYG